MVLVVICGALMALLMGSTYPGKSAANFVWACDGLTSSDVTANRAKEYLRNGRIPTSDTYSYPEADMRIEGECAQELQHVANGTLLGKKRADWWGEFWSGAGWFALLSAVVYVIGMAIGWVWRGFSPKKPDSP